MKKHSIEELSNFQDLLDQQPVYFAREQELLDAKVPWLEMFNPSPASHSLWISLADPRCYNGFLASPHNRNCVDACQYVFSLLAPQLYNLAPEALQMHGCYIHIEGNKGNFCISGSFSEEKVKECFESLVSNSRC